MFEIRFCLMCSILLLPCFAFSQVSTPAINPSPIALTKDEADYQKFIKEHINYQLLTVEHDKFKNQTTINTDPRMTNETEFKSPKGDGTSLDFQAFAVIPDSPTEKDQAGVILHINSRTTDWTYLNCNDFNWLVDDKPFKWINEGYANSVIDGGVLEIFSIFLTPKQFNTLTNSKKIECKICNDEFDFGQKQYWVMRWVNEQLKTLLNAKVKTDS